MFSPSIECRLASACLLFAFAGCGAAGPTGANIFAEPAIESPHHVKPMLVAYDTANGSLAYWPISSSGGTQLQPLTGQLGITNPRGLAANGDVVEEARRVTIRSLSVHCAERFRLNADSTLMFIADSNYLGFPFVDQVKYPPGNADGIYTNGQYASGNFSGFTTIPNSLPN